jgi:hypothetical protein
VPVVGTNLRPPYPPRPAPQTPSKLIEWQPSPASGLDSKMGSSGVLVRQQSAPGEATGMNSFLCNGARPGHAPHQAATCMWRNGLCKQFCSVDCNIFFSYLLEPL